MRRREDHELSKHTINLYKGDYPKLQALYPARIGAGKIIRNVIHAYIRKIESDAASRIIPLVETLEVDVANLDIEGIEA